MSLDTGEHGVLYRNLRAAFHNLDGVEIVTIPLMIRIRDVLYMVEFRCYEKRLARPARSEAGERGARVVPVIGRWLSPVSGHSGGIMAMPIESGRVWDSDCPSVAMTKATIRRLADRDWGATQQSIKVWDCMRLRQDLEQDEN